MQIKSILAAGAIAFGVITVGAGGAVAGSLIDGGDVLNNSLSGADLRNESVTGTDIDNGTVTGYDIRNETLTGADIRNDTITESDLAPGVVDYIEKQVNGVSLVVNETLTQSGSISIAELGEVTLTVNSAPDAGDVRVRLIHPTNGLVALECIAASTELGGSCSATAVLPGLAGYIVEFAGAPATATITGTKIG